MERKYLITQEQLEQIEHYRSMFELNADVVRDLCIGEKDDIVYGFELGKLHSHLRNCFMEMIELENEIRNQKINDVGVNITPKPPEPPKDRILREDGKGLVPPKKYKNL